MGNRPLGPFRSERGLQGDRTWKNRKGVALPHHGYFLICSLNNFFLISSLF